MQDSNQGESKGKTDSDFQRALKFYDLVESTFGQKLAKCSITFPSKYERKNFDAQFQELDDVQRILWCDHNLKEAQEIYKRRDEQSAARKNIWFVLTICRKYNIKLGQEYRLIQMIKRLWLEQLEAESEVKDNLKLVFQAMGQYNPPKASPPPQKVYKPSKKASCGCAGGQCIVF